MAAEFEGADLVRVSRALRRVADEIDALAALTANAVEREASVPIGETDSGILGYLLERYDSDGDGAGDACDTTPHGTDVVLELSAKKKLKAGKPVKVKATCPDEACELSARATFKLPKAALSIAAKTKKLKTKKLGVSLDGGVTQTLKLKLSTKKKKLIAAAKRKSDRKQIKVIVKATATDLGANQDTGKLKLKLK